RLGLEDLELRDLAEHAGCRLEVAILEDAEVLPRGLAPPKEPCGDERLQLRQVVSDLFGVVSDSLSEVPQDQGGRRVVVWPVTFASPRSTSVVMTPRADRPVHHPEKREDDADDDEDDADRPEDRHPEEQPEDQTDSA